MFSEWWEFAGLSDNYLFPELEDPLNNILTEEVEEAKHTKMRKFTKFIIPLQTSNGGNINAISPIRPLLPANLPHFRIKSPPPTTKITKGRVTTTQQCCKICSD